MGQESFDRGIGTSGKESMEVVAAWASAVTCSAALYGIFWPSGLYGINIGRLSRMVV